MVSAAKLEVDSTVSRSGITAGQKAKLPYSRWVQVLCPSPRRHFQKLVLQSNATTGLDIGCGEHSLLSPLRSRCFRTTGVDASPERIENAKEHDLHDEYICGSITELPLDRPFDVVVLSHVIEHLEREEGQRLLGAVEAMNPKLVLVETPNGFLEQPVHRDDPYQRHLSGWFPHDFEGRGYTVFGSGVRWLCGPKGEARCLPEVLVRFINRSLQRYYFRRPRSAFIVTAIRFVDEDDNLCQLQAMPDNNTSVLRERPRPKMRRRPAW